MSEVGRSRENNMFVSAFIGFWAGWTSRDVVRGTEVWSFVEFKLCFCMIRWTFLVERYFGKYLVMKDYVRPVQD